MASLLLSFKGVAFVVRMEIVSKFSMQYLNYIFEYCSGSRGKSDGGNRNRKRWEPNQSNQYGMMGTQQQQQQQMGGNMPPAMVQQVQAWMQQQQGGGIMPPLPPGAAPNMPPLPTSQPGAQGMAANAAMMGGGMGQQNMGGWNNGMAMDAGMGGMGGGGNMGGMGGMMNMGGNMNMPGNMNNMGGMGNGMNNPNMGNGMNMGGMGGGNMGNMGGMANQMGMGGNNPMGMMGMNQPQGNMPSMNASVGNKMGGLLGDAPDRGDRNDRGDRGVPGADQLSDKMIGKKRIEQNRIEPGLRIRVHFIRIRIQHFRLNTNLDPDPGL